jgi:hypothetical protein
MEGCADSLDATLDRDGLREQYEKTIETSGVQMVWRSRTRRDLRQFDAIVEGDTVTPHTLRGQQ